MYNLIELKTDEHRFRFITNFKDSFWARSRYRLAALLTGSHIKFSNEATDCWGRNLRDIGFSNYASLYSSDKNLSAFWRIARHIPNPQSSLTPAERLPRLLARIASAVLPGERK